MRWRRVTATLLTLCLVAPAFGCMHRRRHHEMHERMQAMAAGDAKLEQLVARMNATSGAERVDAMAAVLNELVSQHRSMHQRMLEKHRHHRR